MSIMSEWPKIDQSISSLTDHKSALTGFFLRKIKMWPGTRKAEPSQAKPSIHGASITLPYTSTSRSHMTISGKRGLEKPAFQKKNVRPLRLRKVPLCLHKLGPEFITTLDWQSFGSEGQSSQSIDSRALEIPINIQDTIVGYTIMV